jgi:RNA polymerase sigma factor (sigma-70 family)
VTPDDVDWAETRRWARSSALRVTLDVDLAEVAAQEACLALFDHPEMWGQPEARLRAWLYTVAGNKMRDQLRARNRRLRHEEPTGPDGDDLLFDPVDPGGAEDPVASEAVGDALEGLIESTLPPKLAEVWVLRYRHGLTDREIAAELGIGHGTARNKLCQARALVRRELGIEPDDDHG